MYCLSTLSQLFILLATYKEHLATTPNIPSLDDNINTILASSGSKVSTRDVIFGNVDSWNRMNAFVQNRPITVRDILTNSHGLDYSGPLAMWSEADIPTLEAHYQSFVPLRVRKAGMVSTHNPFAMGLLGLALDGFGKRQFSVSSNGYGTLLREHIFNPLGMSNSYARFNSSLMDQPDANFAPPMVRTNSGRTTVRLNEWAKWASNYPPFASYSTANDIAKVMNALIDATTPEAVALFGSQATNAIEELTTKPHFKAHPSFTNGVAYGGFYFRRVQGTSNVPMVYQVSSSEVRPFFSSMAIFPDEQAAVFVVYSGDNANQAQEVVTQVSSSVAGLTCPSAEACSRVVPISTIGASVNSSMINAEWSKAKNTCFRYYRYSHTTWMKLAKIVMPIYCTWLAYDSYMTVFNSGESIPFVQDPSNPTVYQRGKTQDSSIVFDTRKDDERYAFIYDTDGLKYITSDNEYVFERDTFFEHVTTIVFWIIFLFLCLFFVIIYFFYLFIEILFSVKKSMGWSFRSYNAGAGLNSLENRLSKQLEEIRTEKEKKKRRDSMISNAEDDDLSSSMSGRRGDAKPLTKHVEKTADPAADAKGAKKKKALKIGKWIYWAFFNYGLTFVAFLSFLLKLAHMCGMLSHVSVVNYTKIYPQSYYGVGWVLTLSVLTIPLDVLYFIFFWFLLIGRFRMPTITGWIYLFLFALGWIGQFLYYPYVFYLNLFGPLTDRS